ANDAGNIFVATKSKLGTYINASLIQWKEYPELGNITALYKGADNQLWFTNDSRNRLFSKVGDTIREIKLLNIEGRHTDTLSFDITSVFQDKDKNIWIGTDGSGLLLYTPNHTRINLAPIGFVRSIATTRNYIWASTYKNGLWRLSPDLAQREKLTPLLGSQECVLSMLSDRLNRLWIVTEEKLTVLDEQGKSCFSYPINSERARIFKIGEDTVIVSLNNRLLYFSAGFKPELLKTRPYFYFCSYLSYNGKQWIGTNLGLYLNKGKSLPNTAKLEKVATDAIKYITVIKQQVWVATTSGILVFSDNGRLLKKLEAPTLPEGNIYSLLSDTKNRVWFSTDNGLCCIDPKTNRVHLLDLSYPLQSLEFNSNAFHKSKDGSLYFGGINGLNRLITETFVPDRKAALPVLFSLVAGKKTMPPAFPHNSIELNWKKASFEGRVFAPDYFLPKKHQYSFFLENYDQQWSQPSVVSAFSYPKLPAGNYIFYAKFTDAYGNQSLAQKLYSFTVKPPFWQTWWFTSTLLLLLIALVVYLVRYFQAIKHRKHIIALEQGHAIERERLRISRDMHDELGSGLSRMLMITNFAQKEFSGRNEVLLHLNSISRTAMELHENMNSMVWLLNQEKQTIEVLFARIREFSSDLLEAAGIELIVYFPDYGADMHLAEEAARNIYLSVKEIINNIIKHAGASRVNLNAAITSENLLITIVDNGKGFNLIPSKNSGNGLRNLQTRAQLQKGKCCITTQTGKGTNIVMELPLDQISAKAPNTTIL
ncbi:MAG: hypothetical protein EOO07_16170, partial [Chitinophagaceae bacterium]